MSFYVSRSILPAIAFLSFGTFFAVAASETEHHPHQGRTTPYAGEPPRPELTSEEQKLVAKGEPVLKRIPDPDGQGGRGVAVFSVKAPSDIVWSVISDFAEYPKWISNLKSTQIYKTEGDFIYVAFTVGIPLLGNYTYYIKHTFPPKKNWLTWTLDYSRLSDLDDSVGFWRVDPDPINPNGCIVSYSVAIQITQSVPQFVRNLVEKQGLKQATQWVKEQSEKRYQPR